MVVVDLLLLPHISGLHDGRVMLLAIVFGIPDGPAGQRTHGRADQRATRSVTGGIANNGSGQCSQSAADHRPLLGMVHRGAASGQQGHSGGERAIEAAGHRRIHSQSARQDAITRSALQARGRGD